MDGRMTPSWRDTREQFRHGDLPAALIKEALARFEADGVEATSLRDLARAVGVNHRALYRHFPDKLSLMARVAQEGWLLLGRQIKHGIEGRKPGGETLVAGGVALFVFARAHPNLFRLMGGPQFSVNHGFADLDKVIGQTLALLRQGFKDAGVPEQVTQMRTLIYVSALQGIVSQILVKRFRLTPARAEREVADVCRMLVKGLS
jgi:AcrR family transcriptional regulator